MLRLLTCARGHFWEASESGDGSRCPECGAPADALPPPDLAPGAQPIAARVESAPAEPRRAVAVPGFDILEELPRGPTGIRRFRARQQQVGREVVLEVVLAREDPAQRAWSSLRSEAGLLGKLSHPHIVAIHEAGERDRELFYNAGEHVAGPTLAALAGVEPLPVPQAVALVEALARAVEYAHRRGVVHRHLEPAVVLLQPAEGADGGPAYRLHSGVYIPRITGFGLARRPVEGDPTDAELYQEPGFLSPEQAWGRTKEIGPASDVYGLGGILYFLLAGRPPFRGPTLGDILDAVQTATLAPPSAFRAVSVDLESVCLKALQRRPAARYASAGELADDLRRVGQGRGPAARPGSAGTRLVRWARRQPAVAALLLLCVLALPGTLAGFQLLLVDKERPQPRAGGMPSEVGGAQKEVASLRQELSRAKQRQRFAEYSRAIARAAEAVAANDRGRANTLLDACAEEDRQFEWHYLKARAVGDGRLHLAECDGLQKGAAFHPRDGRFVVIARETADGGRRRGELRMVRLPAADEMDRVTLEAGPVQGLAFSPEGDALAVIAGEADGELCVFEMRTYQWEREVFRTRRFGHNYHGKRLTAVAWSPWGSPLTMGSASGQIFRVGSDGVTRFEPIGQGVESGNAGAWTRLAFHPTGHYLASLTRGGRVVYQWYMQNGEWLRSHEGAEIVHAIAYSPDGVLALARGEGLVEWVSLEASEPVARIVDAPRGICHLAFSPDGSRLAMATKAAVHLWGQDGRGWQELLSVPADASVGLAFSPSGKALATSGARQVVVWGAVGGVK